LFTPGSFAPGLRRQIRNRGLTAQEKIGTLFCFCAQKILDEDNTLAGSIFARKAIFSNVKMSLGGQRGECCGTRIFTIWCGHQGRENVRQAAVLPESRNVTQDEKGWRTE
jgi:hypothetical protein